MTATVVPRIVGNVGYDPTNVAITGGTLSGVTITASSGVPISVASWGVAVIGASTGSMANNGAMTLGTALARIYSEGAWFWLPAGAVAAGVPATAAYRWGVASSTTAVTIYNSTWDGTGVPPLGVTTAYATTGPGAFTGETTETGILITIPANAMGTNGNIAVMASYQYNNSAGAKTTRTRFNGASGAAYSAASGTTTTSLETHTKIWNAGRTNVQHGQAKHQFSSGSWAITGEQAGSVDTTAATAVFISGQRNTATDNLVISGGEIITNAA